MFKTNVNSFSIIEMITWNLDTTLYTKEQLEELYLVLEQLDFSIAKEVDDAIENGEYKK